MLLSLAATIVENSIGKREEGLALKASDTAVWFTERGAPKK